MCLLALTHTHNRETREREESGKRWLSIVYIYIRFLYRPIRACDIVCLLLLLRFFSLLFSFLSFSPLFPILCLVFFSFLLRFFHLLRKRPSALWLVAACLTRHTHILEGLADLLVMEEQRRQNPMDIQPTPTDRWMDGPLFYFIFFFLY